MRRHSMANQLIPFLKRLRLSGILQTLEARNQQAIDGRWTYVEFLARLVEDEVERRAQKQLALRIRRAAINTTKTLEGFDFNFNPSVNRQQVLDLASCTYLRRKRNVLICGPTGVGKTHLAQALTHEACRQGYSALFVNTYRMLQHINGGRADGAIERRCWCWMTLGSSRYILQLPRTSTTSSTNDTSGAASCSPATVLWRNGRICSEPLSSPRQAWTASPTRPILLSSLAPVSGPTGHIASNRRCLPHKQASFNEPIVFPPGVSLAPSLWVAHLGRKPLAPYRAIIDICTYRLCF